MFAQTMPDSQLEPKPLSRLVFRALEALAHYRLRRLTPKVQSQCGKFISALAFLGHCLFPAGQVVAETHTYEHKIEQHLEPLLKRYAREQGWVLSRIEYRHQLPADIKPCPEKITLSSVGRDPLARQQLTLSCPALNWQIGASSQATLWLQAVYAAQGIERGTPLTREHLQLGELEASRTLRDFYKDPSALEGLAAKRRIRSKQLLTPSLVQASKLITRGQQVTITATQQGITASAQGVALSDGVQDEIIRVRNLKTQKIIDAKVLDSAEVSSLF